MMEERLEEKKEEIKSDPHLWHKIECMLFVAGDPVAITELARVLDHSMQKMRASLSEMEYSYQVEGRGVQLLVTNDTAQLVSNRDYIEEVKQLINPDETKSVSQSLLETLAVIAYRQPRNPLGRRACARRSLRLRRDPAAKARFDRRSRSQGCRWTPDALWHHG
ncbi:MAG: SMC-Scp complex subunit ScpB [Eubacteriales bacterium]